jgi:nitroreductase
LNFSISSISYYPQPSGDDGRVKKTAPADYPILSVLADRWSPVAFSSRPVEVDKLNRIFEAARWAPSSANEQPWNFVISYHGTEAFSRMAECLVEGNSWAKSAPVLALSVARMIFARTGQPDRHAMYDTGMAVANLLAQATAEGLFVHQMAGYDPEKARTVLHIPENHEPAAMMAIGYYGDHNSLPEKSRLREEAPRQRKPATEFVFVDSWNARSA